MTDQRAAEKLFWSLVESVGDLEAFVARGADLPALRETIGLLAALRGLTIDWVSVNVDRVDMGLRSDGREWRLVYFVDSSGRVSSMSLFEKPPFFHGVAGGLAVVLNGPSGSGKSSLMQALIERSAQPWVMFDELWLGTVKQAYLIWRDVAPILHDGFLNGMAELAATGNQIILSSGRLPFGPVRDAFANIPTLIVGLDCPLAVLLERERGRVGRWGGLAEASLDAHDGWTYDLRLDSSVATPLELATRVLDAVHAEYPWPGERDAP